MVVLQATMEYRLSITPARTDYVSLRLPLTDLRLSKDFAEAAFHLVLDGGEEGGTDLLVRQVAPAARRSHGRRRGRVAAWGEEKGREGLGYKAPFLERVMSRFMLYPMLFLLNKICLYLAMYKKT
jgi:hypothetical protein